MINTLRIVLLSLSLALLLSACGGGTSTAPPTKVIVKLATSGTLPGQLKIGGLQTEISYPTAENKRLSITDSNIIASDKAIGATLATNLAVPGKISFINFTLSGTGFSVGEFATLTFSIAPGSSPVASDFEVIPGTTIVGSSEDVPTDLSSQISVVIQSVTFQ